MKKVFVAGHKGLAGSALKKAFEASEGYEVLAKARTELDLRCFEAVSDFFKEHKPDWVIIAAALVGGIKANSTYPVEFFLDNIKIQNNLMQAAYENGVEKLLFLGSNCIYPKEAPIPLKEESLMEGLVQETNEAYAMAKICGIKLANFYASQYGKDFYSVIPSTLFGENDNYHPDNAHVLPMLMRKFHEAKRSGAKEVEVWGSGKPLREFLPSDAMAKACVDILEKYSAKDIQGHINMGSNFEISIMDLALAIKEVVGFEGELRLNKDKPDGIYRKALDSSRLTELGITFDFDFKEKLKLAYKDFVESPNTRL